MYVSTKTLRLLGPAWTRAFRCVWMLEELGLPYEIVLDSLPVSRKVRKYVSTGKVPVLLEYDHPTDEYPSFVLSESAAINTYLADHYGGVDKGLIPPAYTQQRARYDEAVSCIVTELDSQGLWIHRKHEAMAQHFGAIPAAVQHAEQHFNRINAHVCQPLVSSPYLLGDEFTAADILYVHCLDWSKGIGWHTHWPAIVHEYRDRCHSRPAYQRAVKARDGDKKDRDALLKQSMSSSNSNNDTATTSKL
jgi:glutathione S-transferase